VEGFSHHRCSLFLLIVRDVIVCPTPIKNRHTRTREMTAKALKQFAMPEGFPELLKDFAREVLRTQPPNVNEFAVEYFAKRIAARQGTAEAPASPAPAKADGARMAAVSVVGTRHPVTEDAHSIHEDGETRVAVVCDGHGGTASSLFVARELWPTVASCIAAGDGGGDISAAIKEGFAKLDVKLAEHIAAQEEAELAPGAAGSGSCAVCAIVQQGTMYVANVGDSRCVLVQRGDAGDQQQPPSAIALSRDHKVSDPDERKRIEAAGGFVHNDRLLGVLAVSQSFGDFEIKKAAADEAGRPILTSTPEVTTRALDPAADVCLVLGSDGLWDVLSNDEVAQMVVRVLAEGGGSSGNPPKRAAEALIQAAAAAGSEDDITAVVMLLP
jgi:serine/threonine protein phosphatase PrpC